MFYKDKEADNFEHYFSDLGCNIYRKLTLW